MATNSIAATQTATGIYVGSDPERQTIGLPGHCDQCATTGHIRAHPKRGCADVGCNSSHETPVTAEGNDGYTQRI